MDSKLRLLPIGVPGEVCIGDIKRDWQYGLNYYLGAVAPDCMLKPTYFRIVQTPGLPPSLQAGPPIAGAAERLAIVLNLNDNVPLVPQ